MKDYVFSNVVRVFVFAFFIFTLSACSESIPKSEQTKALPFSSIVTPNQSKLRVQDAWGKPISLGSASFNLNVDTFISGPELFVVDSGSLLSAWTSHSDFDAQSNRYQSIENTLLKFQVVDTFSDKIEKIPANNSAPILRFDKSSGEILALWQEQGWIKTSRYLATNHWQVAQTIAQGQWGDIVFNQQGDAIVFAVNQQDNIASSISASIFSQSDVSNVFTPLPRGSGVHINQIAATLDANKQSVIVWSETKNGTESLWSAEFSAFDGWYHVQQLAIGSLDSSSNFDNLSIVSSLITGGSELFLSLREGNTVSLLAISYLNGSWSTLNTLLVTNIELDGNPHVDVALNDSSSMAIVWREQQQIGDQIYTQLKSRVFNPSSGWSLPIDVSPSIQQSTNSNTILNIRQPQIYLDSAGAMSVAWIEDGQGTSDLLVNHFDQASKSWLTPELVVSYSNTESSVISASIARDNNGNVIVAWQQKIKNSLTNETNFWRSVHVGSGVLVEQPLQALSLQTTQIVQPSAVWQSPLDVWTETIFSNTVSLIHGPDIKASDTGTGFLSLYKNMDFDPLTGGYLRQESLVLNNSEPGVWTIDQPFPSTTGVTSSEVDIKISTNGDAFALWLVDGMLYFNHYSPGTGWGAETELGSSDSKHDLLFDSNGNVWIFWVFGGDINLQQYIPGTGLQAADMTSIPNAWYFATPAIDANDAINITWISLPGLGSQPFTNTNDLNLITYTPGTGWGFVEIAPPLNSFNSMGRKLTLASTANDEFIAISQDTHGNIFGITYSATNSWGTWENIDYNLDKSDHVARSSRVTSNGENNVMVIWSEETVDIDGSPVYRIYTNRFDPVGDANGVHWPQPERVGAIVPQFDSAGKQLTQYQTLPKIAMLADGRAIATWLDSSEAGSAMYANQYTPGTGWGSTPDQVISYDRLSTGVVKSPDVVVLASGKVLLSWRQEISTEFANEIHVWVTEGQL